MSKIKIECAWCGKFIKYKECQPQQDGETSHGICKECFEKEVKEIKCRSDDTQFKSK